MKSKKIFFLVIIFLQCLFIDKGHAQTWIEYTPLNSGNPAWDISGIIIDSTNAKWLSTEKGLVRFKNNTWTLWDSTNSPLPNDRITSISKDKTNNIWLSFQNKGIFKFDGNNWTRFYYTNFGFTLREIVKIAFDDNNTLWACSMFLGLLKHINNDHWIRYSRLNSGFPDYSATYIAFEGNTKWAGTPTQGIAKYNDTNWVIYNGGNVPGLSNEIHGIAIDKNNNKWFCTRGGGLAKFNSNENQWTIFRTTNSGIPWNNTYVVFIDQKDKKWIAGDSEGGFAIFDDTLWSYPIELGLHTTFDFKEDRYENMWVGQGGRLLVYNPAGVIGINESGNVQLPDYTLLTNYPNPFNGSTKIKYELNRLSYISLNIFDIKGKQISKVYTGFKSAGKYEYNFTSDNLSNGIYFVILKTENNIIFRKIILLK